MALLSQSERDTARTISRIGHTNPFLPERIDLARDVLGEEFKSSQPFLQFRPDVSVEALFPNSTQFRIRGEQLLDKMRSGILDGQRPDTSELEIYEDLAFYLLYARYMSNFLDMPVVRYQHRPQDDILASYDDYRKDFGYYFELPGNPLPIELDADFIFAGLFQIERAFFHVFNFILGGSMIAARMRASVWQSIFTHDMRRYSRVLWKWMGNTPTLITGPSGTGKELVARAIAYSQFVAFDSKNRRFVTDFSECFHGLNLSALPTTLVESELFGYVEGAFTGALSERAGYLDERVCRSTDTLFLDEIGDVEPRIQVKLLRVLQTREFQRLGDVDVRHFAGKLVTATNRDLAEEMEAGRFREDFYYRLCADRITTPSLYEQLQEVPDDLATFVRFIGRQLLPGLDEEVDKLTDEAVDWIRRELGPDYRWPGNIRELEQCVRSIMIRGNYLPTRRAQAQDSSSKTLASRIEQGTFTRDELLAEYFSLVYRKCGSYRAAAKRLGTDWRTVQRILEKQSEATS